MDFNLTEEQAMLREGVSRFVTENYGFEVRRAIAASAPALQRSAMAKLRRFGLARIDVAGGRGRPGVYGDRERARHRTAGLGPGPGALCHDGGIRGTHSRASRGPCDPASQLELRSARAGCALRWRMMNRVRAMICAALPPRRTGTAAVIAFRARRSWSPHAPGADQLIVSARVGDGEGYGLFLLDRGAPGVQVRSYRLLDATPAGDIDLHEVNVDAASAARRLRAGSAGIGGGHRSAVARAGCLRPWGHAKRARGERGVRQVAGTVRPAAVQVPSDSAPIGRDVRRGAGSRVPFSTAGSPISMRSAPPAGAWCRQPRRWRPRRVDWWVVSAFSCTAASV